MTGDELRRAFLNYFQDRGHEIIPSSSLVPHKDPTLLLTSAGMVQIKPYYLGLETPPSRRLTSCQKCFRTTDIDLVGDSRHLTFFEMLGNFSVGDYFKKETILWAWEFVTRYLKLAEERLWVTIFRDDDEACAIWREIGLSADRILRFGEQDNFWGPVGDSGPCGPCSEIHYDLGEEVGCGKAACKPNCDCGRFCEIWNLVFTEYNQDRSGRRSVLPEPHIDTGMGLERTLAAIQGKPSPYETDVFSPLVEQICHLSGKQYGEGEQSDRAIRIVAEHSRGIAFLIADGVMPSNEGRGYILRRILRRASLFGRKLGLNDPFLDKATDLVVNTMSHTYPELMTNRKLITEVTRAEEAKFIAALDSGLILVERLIGECLAGGRETLTGEQVFRLYDTCGFPPELTAEIAREKGLSIDQEGFRSEMEKQRERARAGRKFVDLSGQSSGKAEVKGKLTVTRSRQTHFVGYRKYSSRSKVRDLVTNEGSVGRVAEGSAVDVILDRSPFYGEMGGQVADTGEISSQVGRVAVTNTVRTPSNVTVHRGRVLAGSISIGDEVEARVDVGRRLDIARNHTATHLLQAALRQTLGSSVYQKGSLVEAERLRFDFSHLVPVTGEALKEVQRRVNDWIRQNWRAEVEIMDYNRAIADGAIALFEEQYGEKVRVLRIGRPPISRELCGGTHVRSTGEIGIFLITNQSSIGTGLHRIEATTGRRAESMIEIRFTMLQGLAEEVASSLEEIPDKVKAIVGELEAEHRRVLGLERELSRRVAEDLSGQAELVSGVVVLVARVPVLTMPVLRELGDILRDKLGSAIIVLAAVYDGRPNFLAMVTPDLIAKGFHAGEIINQVARVTGGGGGGKAAMAQGSGRDAARIDEALRLAKSIVASRIP